MPVYEYECTKCKHRFAENRAVAARRTAHCPECRARARKLVHPVGIIFKGSGWHVTDYPTGSKKEKVKSKKETAESKSRKVEEPGEVRTKN